MTVLLETERLRVSVPGRLLVDGFDCAILAGEFVALLGGNGTGKSLLLRTLAGLRRADGGSVRLEGTGIGMLPRRAIAVKVRFLPQGPDAAPEGTLLDWVILGDGSRLG